MCSHWNVLGAGLALCLIFLVITPLNSSLLATQPVTRDIETSFIPLKKLIPFDEQKAAMSGSFLYTSYGVAWLGEKMHSFMTKELITIPFQPASSGEGQDRLIQGKEFWAAQTGVYDWQTELACTLAEINVSKTKHTFSMNKCQYSLLFGPNATRDMLYIGFHNNNCVPTHFLRGRPSARTQTCFLLSGPNLAMLITEVMNLTFTLSTANKVTITQLMK